MPLTILKAINIIVLMKELSLISRFIEKQPKK